jgi:hypothetical protein
MIKVVLVSILSLVSNNALAATIGLDDTFNITGTYSATGGTSLIDATTVQLVIVNSGGTATGDFGTTISFPPPTGIAGSSSEIDLSFATVNNFFTIGGWQLDLSTLVVTDQTDSLLSMNGSGVLTGNGYDATGAIWSFSGESPTSYSMTITSTGIPAVPVPAAFWLFGSGLIGLVAIARRKV